MWNSTGSVSVVNGSRVVTGDGTVFSFPNAQPGSAFIGPDGLPREIASIESATQLTLARPYSGATAGGQGFTILPTQQFANDLAVAFLGFKDLFGGVLDTIAKGMFADGSPAVPSVRFTADQDTGIRRAGDNAIAIVTGGADRMVLTAAGVMDLKHASENAASAIFMRDPSGDLFNLRAVNGVSANTIGTTKARLGLFYGDGTEASALDFKRGGGSTDGIIAFRTNGAERLRIDGAGLVGFGTAAPASTVEIRPQYGADMGSGLRLSNGGGGRSWQVQAGSPGVSNEVFSITDVARGVTPLVIDQAGSLLVGVITGPTHTFQKASGVGGAVLNVVNCGTFYNCDATGFNAATAALNLWMNSTTGRSIGAAGTINASGADYAEYMTKADGCGLIAKGDVCGIDRNGHLVRTWADAVRYVVKSTDPNLVGGDTWAAHLPPRPDAPGEAPQPPLAPDEEADEAALLAYAAAVVAYPAAKAAHDAAVAAHDTALAAWDADLETARHTVDRIAFSGQVPVNVEADTLAACEAALADGVAIYLVAVANGGGIGVTAVREDAMTLPLYMRRVGCVWAIRDGRPWIDVQHG